MLTRYTPLCADSLHYEYCHKVFLNPILNSLNHWHLIPEPENLLKYFDKRHYQDAGSPVPNQHITKELLHARSVLSPRYNFRLLRRCILLANLALPRNKTRENFGTSPCHRKTTNFRLCIPHDQAIDHIDSLKYRR